VTQNGFVDSNECERSRHGHGPLFVSPGGRLTCCRVFPALPASGKVLTRHPQNASQGKEARKGYGYRYSDLQNPDLHRLQHKHEGYK
jgi:hypothetical protein